MDIHVNGQWVRTFIRISSPMTIYLDIHTDIGADVRVELSVLRTVWPGEVRLEFTQLWNYVWKLIFVTCSEKLPLRQKLPKNLNEGSAAKRLANAFMLIWRTKMLIIHRAIVLGTRSVRRVKKKVWENVWQLSLNGGSRQGTVGPSELHKVKVFWPKLKLTLEQNADVKLRSVGTCGLL